VAITGAHALFYSSEPEKLREALSNIFGFPHVDIGGGWLIFALPPAELGVHPSEAPSHELSFMCDDIDATIADLRDKGMHFRGDVEERRFGRAITMLLPGDVHVLLYQPTHPTAI